MATGNPYIDVATAGVGLLGNVFGMNQQADVEREKLEEQRRIEQFNEDQQKARQQAYNATLGRGATQMEQGEAELGNLTSKPLSELEQAKKDVLAGSARGIQQASGQMQANLASQGVRGGQSATLLNRGTGEMGIETQENLNKMSVDEAEQRRNAMLDYMKNKGLNAQNATLRPATF